MKIKLLSIAFFAITTLCFAQPGKSIWTTAVRPTEAIPFKNKLGIPNPRLFELNSNALRQALVGSPQRFTTAKSNVIISFPNSEGELERFRIFESSNMDPALAARYPEIKSYVGQGVDRQTSVVYFSLSPLGLQTMSIHADQSAVFIEPYTTDLSTYVVYRKSDKTASLKQFECKIIADAHADLETSTLARPNADDGKLRNFRLALSVTAEYTTYFGGTKALALAGMNNTMTRVNAVFENDFAAHMNLIANSDAIIYLNAATDPYSDGATGSGGTWNQELQTNLTNVIGNGNYDVGHLFGASGGGGNAGCIGCVCVDPTIAVPKGKGSGYTSPGDGIPQGDNFDIDYVAHEMGHQFGANHTFTHSTQVAVAQLEPGSGSTIMGYAGITGATTDIQAHSDPYFHAISIQQVTNYIKTTTCQTTILTGNAIPTAYAGLDYTIPKGTAFQLTGSGTDADGGDVLTYDWEQMDIGNAASTIPDATRTTGPAFRSINPSVSPSRYFPRMSTVLTGATSWKWEVVPTVARILNFRLTVRDNKAGGAANTSDDVIITVNVTAGPFVVTAPNTAVSYAGASTQTITWNVAGTTANGVNTANVDLLLSTDGGNTYPITLLAATPNDGTQSIAIPNIPGTQNRIMIKGTNHIFFDVSDTNFTITNGSSDATAPTAPTTLAASGTTQSSTDLTWTASTDNVAVTGYDVYKGTAIVATVTGTSCTVTGLSASTAYVFTVKAKDAAGNVSSASNSVNVTTLVNTIPLVYCASQGNDVADELIGRVQLGTINNPSTGGTGYTDFTSIATNVALGSLYTITITPTWTGIVYPEGYGVWIDYNQNGDFNDSGEDVWSLAASTATPVSGSFTIPANAFLGATRMRVSMKYNGIAASCETFDYGQVEDYTVVVVDTTAPFAPTALAASGTTQTTTDLTWNAATDNVAVTGYEVYQDAVLVGTVATPSYTVTGLSAFTTYAFSVKAKDAAGNTSAASTMVNVTTKPIFVIWNGTAWSNVTGPDATIEARIEGIYATIANGTFTAKKVNVNSGSLTINSGTLITIENELVNTLTAAEVVIENNGNLLQNANVANTGTITVQRNSAPLYRSDYTLWSSPVQNQNLRNFSPATLVNRFYIYNPLLAVTLNGDYEAVFPTQNQGTYAFEASKGYLIRAPDNHTAYVNAGIPGITYHGQFAGVPHNGAFSFALSNANNGFNLVGNPYPSALSISGLFATNSNAIDGTLWFWRKRNNAIGSGYATTTGLGVASAHPEATALNPNDVIRTGQGFFVKVKAGATQSDLNFTNAMRSGNTDDTFFRNSISAYAENLERHRIWLNLSQGSNVISQMLLGYMTGATSAVDYGIDGKYFNDSPIALTSSIDNSEYAIQGRSLPFASNDVVPLHFKTNVAGNYQIALDHVDGLFDGNQDIFIKDNLTTQTHDLKTGAYSFVSDSGNFANRFEIVYQMQLGIGSSSFTPNAIVAYQHNGILHVNSGAYAMSKIELYDISGRLIYANVVSGSSATVAGLPVRNQVLVIKITTAENGIVNKKIMY